MNTRRIVFALALSLAASPVFAAETPRTPFAEGAAALEKGSWEAAADHFQAALKEEPANFPARFDLACALAMSGETAAAQKEFKAALQATDARYRPFVLFNLASLSFHRYQTGNDAKDFEDAVAHLSIASEAFVPFRGTVEKLRERPSSGQPWLFRETELPPDSAAFLDPSQMVGRGEERQFSFSSRTSPALYFYGSPAVAALHGLHEMTGAQPTNAEPFFKEAAEAAKARDGRLSILTQWNAYMHWARVRRYFGDVAGMIEKAKLAANLNLNFKPEWIALASGYAERRDWPNAVDAAKRLAVIAPQDVFAQQISKLVLESPDLQPDGTYVSKQSGFRVKKPADWLLIDDRTNSHFFKTFTQNRDELGIDAILAGGLGKDAPMAIIKTSRPQKGKTAEELLKLAKESTQTMKKRFGGDVDAAPRWTEMNGMKVLRYQYTVKLPKSEIPQTFMYYLFLKDRLYHLSFQMDARKAPVLRPKIEQIASSFETFEVKA